MANKYYVLLCNGTKINTSIRGPFSFKEAIDMREYYSNNGVYTLVLKLVIDQLGREVK